MLQPEPVSVASCQVTVLFFPGQLGDSVHGLTVLATGILKEYIKKGFVLDDERMKNGGALFGKDFFRHNGAVCCQRQRIPFLPPLQDSSRP